MVVVTSHCLSSSHQTALAPQCEARERVHLSVELSHPPTPPALDLYLYLADKAIGCHVDLFPQPLSPHFVYPLDCTVLCSPVPDSTLVVHEDLVVDEVCVEHPTCAIIYDEYVWESEEEAVVKDDLLLSTPHLLFPDIFGDFSIVDFPCENTFPGASTSDHSHNIPDVNLPLHIGDDTFSFANPLNISSIFCENAEGEHSCFSSTPLYDSSDHEDVDEHIEFLDHGCHDFFSPSFNHDVDSCDVDLSKPLIFDDLPVEEVETPQVVEALQPEMMVMSSPCYLEVDSTLDQKYFETPKAPHHSLVDIEDQSSSQNSHPPPESHDPIAHALEESYTTSTLAKHKFSFFLMFSRLSQPKECACLSSTRSVMHDHDTSTKFLSYAFILFFSVDIFKLRVCWYSLLYLSCLLVYTLVFIVNHSFTNMGQPMR